MTEWKDLLKPITKIADDEITAQIAAERFGISVTMAENRLKDLTKTGTIVFVGEPRLLPSGKVAKNVWKIK